MSDPITVYEYSGCGTCKKALAWLRARGVAVKTIPIREAPPSAAELRRLWEASGLPIRRLFNTSGGSYRAGGFGERLKTMSDDEALAALAADGMLIKRPIVVAGDRVLVGFKEAEYAAIWG